MLGIPGVRPPGAPVVRVVTTIGQETLGLFQNPIDAGDACGPILGVASSELVEDPYAVSITLAIIAQQRRHSSQERLPECRPVRALEEFTRLDTKIWRQSCPCDPTRASVGSVRHRVKTLCIPGGIYFNTNIPGGRLQKDWRAVTGCASSDRGG